MKAAFILSLTTITSQVEKKHNNMKNEVIRNDAKQVQNWSKVFMNITETDIKMSQHTKKRKNCTSATATNTPPPFKPNHQCLCTSFHIWRLNSVLADYMIWWHLLQVFFIGQYFWISWIILPTESVDNFPNFEYNETSIHFWHVLCSYRYHSINCHMNNVYLYLPHGSTKSHFLCQQFRILGPDPKYSLNNCFWKAKTAKGTWWLWKGE